ncbi:MAG: gephyrin-like molybdotransferase Glp [Gemmataceae bacterium]
MLEVREARRVILQHAHPLTPELTPVSTAAFGHVLGESILSDLDMPPFDKALMDGYAVRCADSGERIVIEEVAAGQTPTRPLGVGQATRVMTGAPLPQGSDCVVPHEQTTLHGDRLTLHVTPMPERFVLRRGSEYAVGQEVLPVGTVLTPQAVGVLAAVGKTAVRLISPPRVAVIATGDELVEPPHLPRDGQLRNSNAPMLMALIHRAGGMPFYLGIGRDSLESLRPLIAEALQTASMVLVTGGVSAGKRDLVPEALTSLQVVTHFHQIAMKPGKPLLFGTHNRKLVFGLPGNPVSSFVCFELLLRPAIRKLAGFTELDLPCRPLPLARDFVHESDRPTYHPARVESERVAPVPFQGSASLSCLLPANALLELPAGTVRLAAGTPVPTHLLEAG